MCGHVAPKYFNVTSFCVRGQVISCMGDQLSLELPSCLPIFLDRLKNEITRLTTVRVITQIAR